jgi:hypothetical protein
MCDVQYLCCGKERVLGAKVMDHLSRQLMFERNEIEEDADSFMRTFDQQRQFVIAHRLG